MKIYSFIADSAPAAVAQIRRQLGPEAVVLNVRQLKPDGLQRIWQKPKIEVLAHLPETPEPAADPLQALTELRREIADLKQQLPLAAPARAPTPAYAAAPARMPAPVEPPAPTRHGYDGWKVGAFLEQTGVLPRLVQRIVDGIVDEHGARPPESLAKEFDLARSAILRLGQGGAASHSAPKLDAASVHIFVGPPGTGKTTVLSKRLAQGVLIENSRARVLRLDGARANTAESLSVYCEILNVAVDRCCVDASELYPGETVFIDLPGVSPTDAEGLAALARQIAAFPGAQVHLTLNAAYETGTLQQQVRAFSALPLADLIFTHLDEEQRWGKLLNFCFGTKVPLAALGAGQNVPGELASASLEKIVSRVIPSK